MGNLEKLEKLQKLKESGAITDEEFKIEKEKLLNNTGNNNKKLIGKITVVLINVIAIALIITMIVLNNKKDDSVSKQDTTENKEQVTTSTSANIMANSTDNVSFKNMNSDDKQLTDVQKDIINYFDNNYFWFLSAESAQKYPKVFEGAKVRTGAQVLKVLESTDEKFEALAVNLRSRINNRLWR